jgi:hypothetical protein
MGQSPNTSKANQSDRDQAKILLKYFQGRLCYVFVPKTIHMAEQQKGSSQLFSENICFGQFWQHNF